MASNLGNSSNPKPKRRNSKKIYISEVLYLTKMDYAEFFEWSYQNYLNNWLGYDENGDPLVTVKVTEVEYNKEYRFDYHRVYGSWYEFQQSSYQNEYIFTLDEQILLAENYQTGTQADFQTLQSPYVVSHHIDDFTKKYKEAAKRMKASRIKSLKYEQTDRDNFSLTIYL